MEKSLTLHPTNAIRAFDVDLAECHKTFIALIYRFRFALRDIQRRLDKALQIINPKLIC